MELGSNLSIGVGKEELSSMFNIQNNRFNDLGIKNFEAENSSNISSVKIHCRHSSSNNNISTINNSIDANYPEADEEFKNNMRDIIREVLQKSDHELKEFLLSNLMMMSTGINLLMK